MRNTLLISMILTASCLAGPSTPHLKLVASNLDRPVWATAPVGSSKFFYIVEKPGVIKILDRNSGKLLPEAFLDIRNKIKIRMNEQGLLGLAFCPQFAKTGRFYINYTNVKGDTVISRFSCNPELPLATDSAKEEILLKIKQDYRNHNGGWISFGPDGYLYTGMGDGGNANDVKNRAQDLSNHLGSLLRIDVSGDKGYTIPKTNPFIGTKNALPEIFAYGLRNPWRCAWDSQTDELYLADVGQGKLEEINVADTQTLNGANFGWRKREGTIATPKKGVGGAKPNNNIEPVFTYEHGIRPNQGLSITGGFIYRGKIKSMQGRYFYADWINPRIWSITMKDGKATDHKDWTSTFKFQGKTVTAIGSFAQDPQGELYILSHHGSIYKIVE